MDVQYVHEAWWDDGGAVVGGSVKTRHKGGGC